MRNRSGIGKNVLLLGIVSFFNDLSSEMIIPILPMFITALGGTGVAVGIIGGVRDSAASILKVFCGYWSDKSGRRKIFVSSGYSISIVFKILLAFSAAWQHVLIFTGLERIGKGLRTAPRDAIISDSMPGKRGRNFGFHRAMDTSGAFFGAALVFVLFWFLEMDFRTIILSAGALSLPVLATLHFVRETPKKPDKKAGLKINIRKLTLPLKLFILVSTVFSLANFSYMFFILRSGEAFEGRLAVGAPILLYMLFNIFYAAFSIPFGNLSDKIGRKKVITFGFTAFALTCLGFGLFNSLPAFIALFAMYGVVFAVIDGNQRAYISDMAPGGLAGTALGAYHTLTGLAALPASVIAGLLWRINPEITFYYGAALGVLSAALFTALGKYFKGGKNYEIHRPYRNH